MKKVLVTGSAGFIASHLLEELVKNKDYRIDMVDDLSTGNKDNVKKYFGGERTRFYQCKIQDFPSIEDYDIIYHLAAKANTRATGLVEFEDNIMATESVTKMLKPNGHLIFSSSCAVYGNQAIVDENSPYCPISYYGCSKQVNELTIKTNCKNYSIFRFANVFGERQDGSTEMGLIGVIDYNIKNKTTMSVYNKGENRRDYIYVKDVVNALVNFAYDKEVMQVGSFVTNNTLDLVKLSGVDWVFGACNTEVDSIQLNNTKLKSKGWKPTLTVTDYIKRLK